MSAMWIVTLSLIAAGVLVFLVALLKTFFRALTEQQRKPVIWYRIERSGEDHLNSPAPASSGESNAA